MYALPTIIWQTRYQSHVEMCFPVRRKVRILKDTAFHLRNLCLRVYCIDHVDRPSVPESHDACVFHCLYYRMNSKGVNTKASVSMQYIVKTRIKTSLGSLTLNAFG